VDEGGILLQELGFEVRVLRTVGVGALVVGEDMAGMNSGTRVSFQGDPGVHLDTMEKISNELLIKMDIAEGDGVKEGQKVVLLLREHRSVDR